MININAMVNRHMARLLSELEDAACPAIFRDAVKKELVYLRDDINGKPDEDARYDKDADETRGNR